MTLAKHNAAMRSAQLAHDNACDCCGPVAKVSAEEAVEAVAKNLAAMDEVGAVVVDLTDSLLLVDWIARNVDVPQKHLQQFQRLDRRIRALSRSLSEASEAA